MRPTAEAVREALFSSLAAEIPGARFADLFAGTGAVGLEALSRGAARALFLEKNPRCVEAIRANAANLGAGERAVIVAGAVQTQWPCAAAEYGPFDLVFADPPYAYGDWDRLFKMLVQERVGLAERAIVVVEHARRCPLPAAFPAWKEKAFGETELGFYQV
jgi:16S rRNA (guanine(966)-N(2))-methyltransferase RsmD